MGRRKIENAVGAESPTSLDIDVQTQDLVRVEPTSLDIDVQTGELVTVEAGRFDHLLTADPSPEVLDAAAVAIKQLDRGGATCAWAVARLLARVKERLWETRMDRYKGFGEWTEKAVGMSRRHADRLIALAQHFDRDDFERFGIGKLLVLLKVKNDQAVSELKAMMRLDPSMSVRELAAEVEAADAPRGQMSSSSPAFAFGLVEAEGTVPMTRIGPNHAIGVLLGIGASLHIALGTDDRGNVVLHYRRIRNGS